MRRASRSACAHLLDRARRQRRRVARALDRLRALGRHRRRVAPRRLDARPLRLLGRRQLGQLGARAVERRLRRRLRRRLLVRRRAQRRQLRLLGARRRLRRLRAQAPPAAPGCPPRATPTPTRPAAASLCRARSAAAAACASFAASSARASALRSSATRAASDAACRERAASAISASCVCRSSAALRAAACVSASFLASPSRCAASACASARSLASRCLLGRDLRARAAAPSRLRRRRLRGGLRRHRRRARLHVAQPLPLRPCAPPITRSSSSLAACARCRAASASRIGVAGARHRRLLRRLRRLPPLLGRLRLPPRRLRSLAGVDRRHRRRHRRRRHRLVRRHRDHEVVPDRLDVIARLPLEADHHARRVAHVALVLRHRDLPDRPGVDVDGPRAQIVGAELAVGHVDHHARRPLEPIGGEARGRRAVHDDHRLGALGVSGHLRDDVVGRARHALGGHHGRQQPSPASKSKCAS